MKKKIFFIDGLINISAAQIFLFLQKIISDKKDFELFFLSSKNDEAKWPYTQFPLNLIRMWENDSYVRKLFTFFKNNKSSVIHLFFELRMFGTLKSAIRFPFLLYLLKRTNAKIILTLYNPFIFRKENSWQIIDNVPFNIPIFIMKVLIHLYVKSICGSSHKIIVENNIVKSGLVEYFDITSDKIIVINHAVPQDKRVILTTAREKYHDKFSNKKIILCFGVISPRKGQSNAIRAFKIIEDKLPNHILVIAGRRTPEFQLYEKSLLNTITELNLQKKVFFLGEIGEEEVNVLFEISDIALFPYHPAIYGSGAFSFALQYEKPSIVTSIDTFKEILGDDGGIFVDPNDDEQLAEAIFKLSTDFKLREEIMDNMKTISKSRSCDIVASKHFEIYKQILK
jgi:glycosyltransferase involved in cell wall biosynthesis